MTQPLILAHQTNSITINDAPGTATDQLVTKRYVDQMGFTIYGPKAGQSADDSTIPIYSDFKFSLGATRQATFQFVDNQARNVILFAAMSPTDVVSWFRAYRYNDSQSFVFDNDPLSVPGLNPSEQIYAIVNVGTYYITVQTTTGRLLIVSTNASSSWQDWSIAYDVSSVDTEHGNFSVVSTPSGLRLIKLTTIGDGMEFNVLDTSLNTLRTQRVLTYTTDIDKTDYSGQGRTALQMTADMVLGYTPAGRAPAFAWSKFTNTFNARLQCYAPYKTAAGVNINYGFSMTLAWNIPLSWIENGTGTPTNLVSVKNGSYRYREFKDDTWDTDAGGMSDAYGISSNAVGLTVDEYSGQTYFSLRETWRDSSLGAHFRYKSGYALNTIGLNAASALTFQWSGYGIPDGSPWAKALAAVAVDDDRIIMVARSTRYGANWVTVPFSTTSFKSVTAPDDTLKLSSGSAHIVSYADPGVPSVIVGNLTNRWVGVTNVGGTPVRYWCRDGAQIYQMKVLSTGYIQFTATGVNVPTLPATLGSITLADGYGIYNVVWNGNTSSPKVWATVHGQDNMQYMAVWSGGAWSLASTAQLSLLAINAGNASRNDNLNLNDYTGSAVLTASGKIVYGVSVLILGSTQEFISTYDTVTNVGNTVSAEAWLPTGVNGPGQYKEFQSTSTTDRMFGYSTTYGYYQAFCNYEYYAAVILSSRNVQTGATISEAQWIDGSATRYQKFVTVEAATGLVAYMVEYPIVLGGYVTKTPERALQLYPNTVNYIYVTKDPSNTTDVTTDVTTVHTPSSFSRILVAAVTTNATDVVSSVQFSYDGSGLPSYEGNPNRVLSNDGTQLVWVDPSGSLRIEPTSTVVTTADESGTIVMNNSSTAVTIPQSAAFVPGTRVMVYVGGNYTGVTISPAAGVTLTWVGAGNGATGARSLAAYAAVELQMASATNWTISGQGIS